MVMTTNESFKNIIEFVQEKLLEQNEPSIFKDKPQCFYRSPTGLKCGIGFLISNTLYAKYYNKNIEGVAASHLPEEILKSIQCTFNVIDKSYNDFLELLIRIQNVHDTSLNSDLPFKNHIVKGFNDLKLQYK